MSRRSGLEARWPAALSVLAAGALFWGLPSGWLPGPDWLVLALAAVLLVPVVATHRAGLYHWNHALGIGLLCILTLSLVVALAVLIHSLPSREVTATQLLRSAVVIWGLNILVFGNWYWRLDAGGPHRRRAAPTHRAGAFLFPQMLRDAKEAWQPGFVDYLFLAFNTSTAFSPTDVSPLDPWAKLLMMAQSLISLATLAILAGRAVNIL